MYENDKWYGRIDEWLAALGRFREEGRPLIAEDNPACYAVGFRDESDGVWHGLRLVTIKERRGMCNETAWRMLRTAQGRKRLVEQR